MTAEHHPDCDPTNADGVRLFDASHDPDDIRLCDQNMAGGWSAENLQAMTDKLRAQSEGNELVYMNGTHSFGGTPETPIRNFGWRGNNKPRTILGTAYMIGVDPAGGKDESFHVLANQETGQVIQLPPRTIDELVAAMESMFEVGEPGESGIAATGEPFQKYGIGYRICLDAPVRDHIKLKLSAIKGCWNTARELREKHGAGAVLYWREKPTLREEHDFDRDELIGQVTMRLLISDKPPLTSRTEYDNFADWAPGRKDGVELFHRDCGGRLVFSHEEKRVDRPGAVINAFTCSECALRVCSDQPELYERK